MHYGTLAAITFGLAVTAVAVVPEVAKRQEACDLGYSMCPTLSDNDDAGGGTVPATDPGSPPGGSDTPSFIIDVGESGRHMSEDRRSLKRRDEALCCAASLQCMYLLNTAAPLCYDPLTADFFLADGSNGNDKTGEFYSVEYDANINLSTGDYVYANGTRGNAYDDENLPRPTDTAPPPQPTGDVISAYNTASSSKSSSSSSVTSISTPSTASSSSALALANRVTDHRHLYGFVGLAIILMFG